MAANAVAGGEGAGSAGINQAMVNAQQVQAGTIPNSGITSVTGDGGGAPIGNAVGNAPEPFNVNQVGRGIGNGLPPVQPSVPAQPSYGLQSLNQAPIDLSQSGSLNTYNGSQLTSDVLKPQLSDLENGWNKVTDWMGKNPMTAALGTYGILKATGALNPQNTSFNAEPYSGPLNNYRLSPNFQTYPKGPNTNIYRPTYASGGIVAFSPGGDVSSAYSKMLDNSANVSPPASRPDVGIFTDSNPNTRRLNAPDAALYYQNAVNNRYGINTAANLPKGAMGRVNTVPVMAKQKKSVADDVEAASGGIMSYAMGGGIGSYYPEPDDGQGGQHPQDTMMGAHPSVSMGPAYPMQGIKSNYAHGGKVYGLGDYANGGIPRLLKGPGDGMSDNIPATIADKQPARLADGEFVIPADVVSGLGNGSTEAGAKHLHEMMDKIRQARTGTKKQGKQINASKFIPK
jgi:hypothetical protein